MDRSVVVSGVKSSVYGLIVGDIIDKKNYIWGKNSSLSLATMEALSGQTFNPDTIIKNFIEWAYNSKYTACGEVFDIDTEVSDSITFYAKNKSFCKKLTSPSSGSLARILPIGLKYYNLSDDDIMKLSFGVSKITHRNKQCELSCFYYCLFVAYLLRGYNKREAYKKVNKQFEKQTGIAEFGDLLNERILEYNREQLLKSHTVLNVLSATIWCVLKNNNYKGAVSDAIELKENSGSLSSITGGIAGIIFGDIPLEWINKIKNKSSIDNIIGEFNKTIG